MEGQAPVRNRHLAISVVAVKTHGLIPVQRLWQKAAARELHTRMDKPAMMRQEIQFRMVGVVALEVEEPNSVMGQVVEHLANRQSTAQSSTDLLALATTLLFRAAPAVAAVAPAELVRKT